MLMLSIELSERWQTAEAKQVSNLKKYLMQIPNTCAQILRKSGVYCFRGEMPTPNTAERSCKHWILHNALKDPDWNYSLLFYNKVGRADIYFYMKKPSQKWDLSKIKHWFTSGVMTEMNFLVYRPSPPCFLSYCVLYQ